MDFFTRLGETISTTGKDVSQKAKDLTGIAKLNLEIRSKEEFVLRQYTEIGKQYFELHKEDAEPLFAEITAINEAMAEMEELESRIADLKGQKKCQVCGAILDSEANFCIKCGAKCESIFEDEEDSEDVETVAFTEAPEEAEDVKEPEEAEPEPIQLEEEKAE